MGKILRKILFNKKAYDTENDTRNPDISEKDVNFFNTFGFLKVPRFFAQEIKLINREFDRLMKERFGDALNEDRNFLYPQFMDNSSTLSDLLLLPKITALAKALVGDGFVYKGSDGNIFTQTTGWHRDYLIRTKSCKILIYLDSNNEDNGALRVIPGSQFIDDT